MKTKYVKLGFGVFPPFIYPVVQLAAATLIRFIGTDMLT